MKSKIYLLLLLMALVAMACRTNNKSEFMENNGTHEDWSRKAVIYEVNIRQYTPEGTINAFAKHLPRLQRMGVDILWLMPVHPVGKLNRKGSLGSYYAVQDYRAVNPEFGTMDDLKNLVHLAHDLGMKVILDWVANHAAWDNVWTVSNPDFFEKDEHGKFISPYDWTDVISLDYNNPVMRDSMIAALKFWITDANIDGYRCDVAGMVPTDFWNEARKELEALKPVFMLAEDEDNADLLREAFDMNYAWKVHKIMNGIAKGEKKIQELRDYFLYNDSVFDRGSYRMNFITNHDENSWNGTEFKRMGKAVDAFAALTFLMPGMPLIYSGQEAGLDKELRFFDKDTIIWGQVHYEEFYTKLIKIKKKNQSLWNGLYGAPMVMLNNNHPDQVLSFERRNDTEVIVGVFNLSDKACIDLHLPLEGRFKDLLSRERIVFSADKKLNLKPWEFRILKMKI
jgi:alpha-amylase